MRRHHLGPWLLLSCLPALLPGAQKSAFAAGANPSGAAQPSTIPEYARRAIGELNPDALPPAAKRQLGFFARLAAAYKEDWRPAAPDPNAPPPPAVRRGYSAPLNSPPFPSSDWSIGGSPLIGTLDQTAYPLQAAINGGKHGAAWEKSRVKLYGWLNGGFNASTSNKDKFANAPAAYDVVPNSVQLDQAVLYIERVPDTFQTAHFDWGFRLAQLYGLDYRYTTSKGVFSQQLLASNNTYGYDPVSYYADLYFPHVAQGMNVRVGRYISIPDVESQLSPNNYAYSHSLLYTYDAFTQTGILLTFKLNDRLTYQIGLNAGNDVAPWTSDAKPTLSTCLAYYWSDGNDMSYTCANSLNDGLYAYDNIQAFFTTYYHRFSNPAWHTATESYYMYERRVPNVAGNVANPPPTQPNAYGAFCDAGQLRCYAPEWGVVNYIEHEFNNHRDAMTIRNEYYDDIRGQRTGTLSRYTEDTLSFTHFIGTTVTIRPEIRLDHSYDAPAYDDKTKKTQFMFAGDIIYHF